MTTDCILMRMATFRMVISDPKTRRALQKEVDQAASDLLGKKLGDNVQGDGLGLDGYTIEITGGSDKDGFPMRKDVEGQGRKRILLAHPPGFRPERKGQRKRKSIRGNTISADIMQINAKVVGYGKRPAEEIFGLKKKEVEKPAAEEGKAKKREVGKEAMAEKAEPAGTEEKKEEKPVERAEAGMMTTSALQKSSEAADMTTKDNVHKSSEAEAAEKKMGVKKLE